MNDLPTWFYWVMLPVGLAGGLLVLASLGRFFK